MLSLVITASLVFVAGEGQNQAVAQREQHIARSVLQVELERLGQIAKDYSWWDDAYDNLIAAFDPAWADKNVGTYLHENLGIHISAVVRADRSIVYAMVAGTERAFDPFQDFSHGFAALAAAARLAPFDAVEAATGLLTWDGRTYLGAVSRFTSQNAAQAARDGPDRGWLVLARALDETLLQAWSERFLLTGLRLEPESPGLSPAYRLAAPDGAGLGWLTWRPNRPGDDLMVWLLPGIALAGSLMAFLGWRIASIWHAELGRSQRKDEQLHAILDGAADAIVAFDSDGTIVRFNRAAETLFGCVASVAAGRSVTSFLSHAAETPAAADGRSLLAGLVAAAETGAALTDRLAAARVDGGRVPIELALSVAGTGDEALYTAIIRDVAQRREIERHHIAAREAAEAANRAKSEFVATVSHELRTPLVAIIGFSDLLRTDLQAAGVDRHLLSYLNDIHESGSHLLALVNDIIDLARIDTADTILVDEALSVDEMVSECLRLVRERADKAGVILSNGVIGTLPLLVADRSKLKKMLTNLLSNAVKFSHGGGSVAVTAALAEDGGLVLRVEDAGIGIAAKHLDLVLRPFYQVDGSFSRQYGGTGLGLPLTKGLIELHGGRLEIESRLGAGTTVALLFPKARVLDLSVGAVAGSVVPAGGPRLPTH